MSTAEPSGHAGRAGTGETVELAIDGMHCESCVALVEEVLGERTGVQSVTVDLNSATSVVRFDPTVVDVDDLREAIAGVGYSATRSR
jgi:copper chaperone CopZ